MTLILALAPAPAMGQPSEGWSAWLINASTNALVRVNLDGDAASYPLPLPEGAFLYSFPVFSRDGSRFALCLSDAQGSLTLRVHDVSTGTDLVDYPLGVVAGCNASAAAFSDDGAHVAFGVLNYYPGDPQADAGKPIWELLVFDMSTGEIMSRLDAAAPALAGLDLRANQTQMGFMPVVRAFGSGQVAFALMPWGTEGPSEVDGLLWEIGSGAVSASELHGKMALDILNDTGEIVWLDADESLPMADPLPMLGPAFNVLMYLGEGGEAQRIFTQPISMVQVRFIDDGRRVAVQWIGAFDEQTGTAPSQWLAVDRAGAVEALPPELGDHSLVNAPEGFAILHTEYRGKGFTDPLTQLLYFRRAAEGEGWLAQTPAVLWEDPSEAWMIAWSPAVRVTEALAPFTPVGP